MHASASPELTTLTVLTELDRVWGRARIGLVLTSAFHRGSPASTDEIAATAGYNKATIQLRLKDLINVGRCCQIKVGRTTGYCATEPWAIWTREQLNALRN